MPKDQSQYKVGSLIYDVNIYDGQNTSMVDLKFYKRWLPQQKNARILELCCGTGRLTLPIARDGYDITGIDITSSMLKQARQKATAEGLDIPFIKADMRYFNLQETYDLIFIPFNSIHHLYKNDDIFKMFKTVKKHLKEDGFFIIDCFNPNIELIAQGKIEPYEIAKYTTKDGRNILIKERMHYENNTQINRIKWHYYINGEFDSIQNLDMRLFFPQELDAYLQWHGYTIKHKFGSFKEERFNENSEKQILVCQKVI